VREVWLVDLHERRVLVSRRGAPKDVAHQDDLLWHPPEMATPLSIDLHAIFAGLD
jgi:hypothetical protein